MEFLSNVKTVMERQLLSRDDFYDNQNLLQIFGGESVRWFLPATQERKFGQIEVLDAVFQYKPRGKSLALEFVLSRKDQAGADEHRIRFILNPMTAEGFNLSAIEEVFGHNGTVIDPYLNDDPAHPRPLSPRTHPLGNRELIYHFASPSGEGYVEISITGNGSIWQFSFGERE